MLTVVGDEATPKGAARVFMEFGCPATIAEKVAEELFRDGSRKTWLLDRVARSGILVSRLRIAGIQAVRLKGLTPRI